MVHFPFPDSPSPEEPLEIAPGVLWLRIPLPMVLNHVNVYAFATDDGWDIVDTGLWNAATESLWERLLAGPLGGRPVKRVLVTHHHLDHIGMAGWFQARGAELWTSRTSWLMGRMLQLDVQDRHPPETLAFWRAAGMEEALWQSRRDERPMNSADSVFPLPLGYRRLREGDVIDFGARRWQVRMGDGHAPEHVTLWQEDGPLVVGGDQLLASISANIGVYATEPEADPLSEWLAASERLMPQAREDQLVLAGHKLPFTGLPHRLKLMVDNHHAALRRLLDHLAVPRTACGCFMPLFKREITGGAYGLALVEAVAHLNHLRALGQVTRQTTPEGVWLWQRRADQGALQDCADDRPE